MKSGHHVHEWLGWNGWKCFGCGKFRWELRKNHKDYMPPPPKGGVW